MKAALLIGILGISVTLWAQASGNGNSALVTSTTASASQSANPGLETNSGAVLPTQLIRGLDVRKAKLGDTVVAKCTEDLNAKGQILIPKNAKLIGHVTYVQTRGRGKTESILEIAFDKAILRDGRVVPISASIQALASPAILASDVGDANFGLRNALPGKNRTSGLFAGARKTISPEAANTISAPALTANGNSVVGVKGLQLDPVPAGANRSVIRSSSQNVRLESGTRLILRVSLP